MSYYEDDRPRRQKRDRRPRDTEYGEETVYTSRNGGDPRDARRETSLVRATRRDDSPDSIEEVERDWAPGDRGYVEKRKVVREGIRPVRARSISGRDRYDDRYSERSTYDYAPSKQSSRRNEEKRDRRPRRYEDSSDESSRSPPRRPSPRRRKSLGEEALAALGLGGAAGAIFGKSKDRSRSRSRGGRRRRSSSSGRTRGGGRDRGNEKIIQAVKAAVLAGAGEAFRARNEPGGWGGDKGKRVLTAAISAGGVDGLIDRDPDKHSTRNTIGSALAGLATTHLVNGPRSQSRGPRGRDESRGRDGDGVRDLAAGGVLAAAGKSIYDRVRSKSRDRGRRSRSSSSSGYDSRSPPRRNQKRSNSVSAHINKGLAALGLGEAADGRDRRDRRYDEEEYYRSSRDGGKRGGGGYSDSRDVGRPRAGNSMVTPGGGVYSLDYGPRHNGDPETDSDSDLGSSSGDEKDMKSKSRKQLLTGGLAAVATIHAAHSVYQSIERREVRKHKLAEGEISRKEAEKEKNKARLQDLASVGIAALGIKGAMSEWNEMKESREEMKEASEKHERHREKREARRRKLEKERRTLKELRYSGSMPNLAVAAMPPPAVPYYNGAGGPQYMDDNPYAAAATYMPPAPDYPAHVR